MVDFLSKLPKKFWECYLNTHSKYLKSFADIATHLYFPYYNAKEKACEIMVKKLLSAGNFSESKVNNDYESKYFRNLRNAWYHEVVLNYPDDNFDQRLKFAPWKIIQCYYSVFAGISALVRCFYNNKLNSHRKTFNLFGDLFLKNSRRRIFFLPPYNFHLNQQGQFDSSFEENVNWDYGTDYHFPIIEKCLKSIKKENLTTFLHYLKELRDWVQYEDAYLFFRLYGENVKKDLDYSLKRITFGYLVQVEFFFIKLFGWEDLERQFESFIKEFEKNLGIEPISLLYRYGIYQEYLSS